MFLLRRFLSILVILILGACSTMAVDSNSDPAANFSNLKNFAWMPGIQTNIQDPRIDNTRLDELIRKAIEGQLAAQGFRKQASGAPDFSVAYHATLDKKTTTRMLRNAFGYNTGGVVLPEEYTYDEGTLILDIVEPKTRKLIWRGSATDRVNPSPGQEVNKQQIDEAVQRILAQFPPN